MDAETAGFKVAVEGTTATVVLKEPYETARTPHSDRLRGSLRSGDTSDRALPGLGWGAVGGRLGEATLPGVESAAKAARWGHAALPG